jgi:branched-chain amino acid transport system substrate-binding protein
VALAGVLALVTVLGGCSLSSTPQLSRALCIATDFPLVGASSEEGKAAQNGANLAISQTALGSGYTLDARGFDDSLNGQPDAGTAAMNLNSAASEECVLALVGPLQDALAASAMPLAANSGLPMVSPGTASPGLTRAAAATLYGLDFAALHPARKPITFFRLLAPDDQQAAAAARAAIVDGQTQAYVVDDGQIYGRALATFFTQAYQILGGTVVGTASLTSGAGTAAADLATAVRASRAQLVYYGGATGGGAALRLALGAPGQGSPSMLGASGIAGDAGFVRVATAPAAEGTEATRAAPDVAALPGAGADQFRASYRAKFDAEPTSASVLGYDAASVVIAALRALIAAGQRPTRENVRQRLTALTFQGLEGTITFDGNGDNVGARAVSLYVVRGGAWVYLSRASTS